MSATFLWEVVKPSAARTVGGGTSSDSGPLQETFGNFPCQLDEGSIDMLKAMHRATREAETIYGNLADLVEKHGTISLWVEY